MSKIKCAYLKIKKVLDIVRDLEIIPTVIGMPVENSLAMAIKLAKTNAITNLPDIRWLLKDVQKYMYEYGMN